MRFEYAAAAVDEVSEALAYYKAIDVNLSKRMVREIDEALNRIQQFPDGWHPLTGGLRQLRLKSFPYVVIYKAQKNQDWHHRLRQHPPSPRLLARPADFVVIVI